MTQAPGTQGLNIVTGKLDVHLLGKTVITLKTRDKGSQSAPPKKSIDALQVRVIALISGDCGNKGASRIRQHHKPLYHLD